MYTKNVKFLFLVLLLTTANCFFSTQKHTASDENRIAVEKLRTPGDNLTAKAVVPVVIRGSGVISAYDHIMRAVSLREGLDWRLLSAIAFHESRFDPTVVSHRGASGLMQIMPAVARQFNISHEEVQQPEINILVGAKLLRKIERSLKFPPSASPEDRIRIILACYNGGIGHVTDARRLAVKYGFDPNSWAAVSRFLSLKAEPHFSNDEVVKCGTFRGSGQTIAFVENVMSKYDSYCRIAAA